MLSFKDSVKMKQPSIISDSVLPACRSGKPFQDSVNLLGQLLDLCPHPQPTEQPASMEDREAQGVCYQPRKKPGDGDRALGTARGPNLS